MNRKRILLIGGTGSMGVYLTELLLKQNYQVEVAAIAPGEIEHPNLQSFILDARDIGNLTRLLETRPDAVIDFLDYKPAEYRKRCELFLRHTKHYFFLSSYRVYTDLAARPTVARYFITAGLISVRDMVSASSPSIRVRVRNSPR